MVAFLNPWGILRAGLAEFPEEYANFTTVEPLLRDLVQEPTEEDSFTEAVFLTPPQALTELRTAGFELITYAGAEAFAAGMRSELTGIATADPPAYENVLRLATETCELPQYRDSTEHLHAVVRKPL